MNQPRRVADLMTKDPITLREEDDLWVVQEEMGNLALRHMPVVDGKKLVGLLTYETILQLSEFGRDALHRSLDDERKHGVFVASVMARDVTTVSPDMPLHQAARLLASRHLSCLPVVLEDRTLVGIVTDTDFITLAAGMLEASARGE